MVTIIINFYRSDFCFKETKLYGASRMLVHDWVRENDADVRNCYKWMEFMSDILLIFLLNLSS